MLDLPQLQELQEELRQRESRWGAAQSRLRLRIQSLEKENQELRNDLKMMEQTRLQLWQKQVGLNDTEVLSLSLCKVNVSAEVVKQIILVLLRTCTCIPQVHNAFCRT